MRISPNIASHNDRSPATNRPQLPHGRRIKTLDCPHISRLTFDSNAAKHIVLPKSVRAAFLFYSPVSFQNKRILKRIAVGVYRQNQPAWLRRRRNGKKKDDSGFTWTYFLLDIVWKEPVSPHGDSKWWKTNFRLNRKCIASPPVGKKTQRQISVKASDNIKI